MSVAPYSRDVPLSRKPSPAAPIGVFDSGVGGLSVLRHLLTALPSERFVYVADSARAPYGGRPPGQILGFSRELVDYLVEVAGCKLVVMACNTATAAAAATLRAERPAVPIVGMEPAVKPAARATRTGVVGVMATAGTIASDKYARLLSEYAAGARVIEDDCAGLVALIEAGHLDDAPLRRRLREILQPMSAAGADVIVLGCTHFPLVADVIAAVAGPEVTIVDPAPAVARQTGRVLRDRELLTAAAAAEADQPRVRLLTTGAVGAFETLAARVMGDVKDAL